MIPAQRALLLVVVVIGAVDAWNRPNHFGNPCYLCKCFVEYTDRDVGVPVRPYAMALDGYDSTEDRCLASCSRDNRCKAVVYGMVGGRKVFTCEFYERIDTRSSPVYAPFINIYIKRSSCPLSIIHLPPVTMIPADDSSIKRRTKQEKNSRRPNPFFG
ncbi:unnamed protein product [Caenorhabditis auriculariae]|uniref:Apple domain-containing protein n=1 Tax=Caenorhabditis auriculariae TaxID=2777116 RepID=A0A8S1HHK7_9PELO|nr:unnamed protein product [Caenorhabditis auriculariae]